MSAELLAEARRDMEICNACRYCEGFCAVFPAMELRRAFSDTDLNYLANLCHNCKGCYYACQYAPPHPFGVNVPRVFAELRVDTYRKYAWPAPLAAAFERNGVLVSLLAAVAAIAVLLVVWAVQGEAIGVARTGSGSFYRIISYPVILVLASVTFLYAILALTMSGIAFWRDTGGGRITWPMLTQAVSDVATLRNLGGNQGDGCNDVDEGFSNTRRWLHHAMFYGFLLCFAATASATVAQDFLGMLPPYAWWSVPVVLGFVGGVLLMIGTIGFFSVKLVGDGAPSARRLLGMDVALLMLLAVTAFTGLLTLFLRDTGAMGPLLAVHFGVVLALFLVLPYSKFVHGIHRTLALIRYAGEFPRKTAPASASAATSASA